MNQIETVYTQKIRDAKRVRIGLLIVVLACVIGGLIGCAFAFPILIVVGVGVGLASVIGIGNENEIIREAEESNTILMTAYWKQNPK
jgi:hypothetical protein